MGSLKLGSVTDSLGSGSTDKITDQIADSVGEMVSKALKTMLGNLS